MGIPFDHAPDRPQHISAILNGLDRYNPETTSVLQDYVSLQCEDRQYDCFANLALLKLYQFNPHLSRDEPITNILVKALTVFPAADFSLCLHLLPPSILNTSIASSLSNPAAGDAPLSESVQKLNVLNTLLSDAQYAQFWATLNNDDLYADLIADVSGFEELIRIRIAEITCRLMRAIERPVLESWLNLKGKEFETFVKDGCSWTIEGDGKDARVIIPLNKENEAKGTVVRENVKFDQFARIVKRAYEQPA